ncbi:hypothetical protein [Paludisphaera borealis]|uniref:Uncharacterized protein n=1 Tax=Paludisphaera borealis TaxID=1387353 RepID=A0A1U7CMG6_9BACT|nr:hypothetical protein [Paludisphaera borealis]APW60130.1 hypothetical protein BSF38_01594 [Paludisphaera borealis]
MKLPRLSVNSVMIVVFAVAVDCMAIRSIRIRPGVLTGALDVLLLGTLPMANILAVVLTRLVWRRDQTRPFRLGFVVVGLLAVLGTAVGLKPLLSYLESVLVSTTLGDWLESSEIGAMVVAYGVIPGLLLLLQLLAALTGGSLARKFAAKVEAAPAVASPRRLRLGALSTMTILLAAPALVTEGTLRWKIDSMTFRHRVGAKAVIDVKVFNGWRVALRDGSTFLLPNGSEVRVDDDSQPSSLAGIRTSTGEQFGDHRAVRVTLLDGEWTGEPTSVPRQLLRAVR